MNPISNIPCLVPTQIDSWDSIDQRVQIEFPQDVVWDFLWDIAENRVLAYKDNNVVYEIHSHDEITVNAAIRCIGYDPSAYQVFVDAFEHHQPLKQNVPILDIPIRDLFLLKMILRVAESN